MNNAERHDHLEEVAQRMLDEMTDEADPDVRGIVLLQMGTTGGILMRGYDEEREAITDVLCHLDAMCKHAGMTMQIHTLNNDPENN